MRRSLNLPLMICAFVWFARSGTAEDWPQWLGPRRDSVWRETGIVDKFPADGPTVVWRQPVGFGFAGPAVANGRVFVTDYVTNETFTASSSIRNSLHGKERVLCLSARDGKLIWKYEYDRPYHIAFPYGPRVTPTVDGDRVYTLGAEGNLVCLKVADGSVVWSKDLPKEYEFETPIWGVAGHPLIEGDKIICVAGGAGSVAIALDKMTGKERWRALTAPEPGYCPPTMIQAGGARQLLIWHSESLNSLDPVNGSLYWSVPIRAAYAMAIATPRMDGPYLFVGAIINKSLLLKMDDQHPRATPVWRGAKGRGIGPVFSTPFLEKGYMYGVDRKGELRCVKLATGAIVWSSLKPTTQGDRPSEGTAFLVKQGDRFFLANDQGELIIAKLSPRGYQELSRCKILEPTTRMNNRFVVWSHPAFAERSVFARNDKVLVRVSLAK